MTDWAWPWWTTMVCINLLSFGAGLYLFRRSAGLPAQAQTPYLRTMRRLGMIFVTVALYRSVFVSSYLEQLAWFDVTANSSLLIRFLAFFAELSFAGLFALALLQLNRELPPADPDSRRPLHRWLLRKGPQLLFGCIFIAQFFATTALITKYELLFAIEETLWGIAFIAIVPLAIDQLARVKSARQQHDSHSLRMYRVFTLMTSLFCALYCSYSLLYHLPIEYWPHVIEDLQSGNVVFRTGIDAIADTFLVVNETKDFQQWGGIGFLIWHSGYFSICVWMVLFLMCAPRLLPPAHSSS